MAIHPKLHPHAAHQGTLTPQQAHSISTWTEQATESLQAINISSPTPDRVSTSGAVNVAPRQASVPLLIPIDDQFHPSGSATAPRARPVAGATKVEPQRVVPGSYGRREPLHRDSMKRREALLKGKEGSRRRQRWENGSYLIPQTLGVRIGGFPSPGL